MGKTLYEKVYDAHVVMQKEGELPLNNWIWFGLHRREGLKLSLVCEKPDAKFADQN